MDQMNKEAEDKEASKNRVKKKRGRSSNSKKSLASCKTKNSKDSEPPNQNQTQEDTVKPTENGLEERLSISENSETGSTSNTVGDELVDPRFDKNNSDTQNPNSEPCVSGNNGFGHRRELAITSVEELNHCLHLYVGNIGDNLIHYGVTVLKLVDCNLTTLPHELGLLASLEVINVSQNKLEVLPDSIGQLQNLHSLHAEFNDLTSLPKSIKNLKSLSLLTVSDNMLNTLPNGISDLKKLDTLDVSCNVLRALPVVFESAPMISRIYAQKNLLKSLPPWLNQVKNLRELHLGENHISTWSEFKTFGKVATNLQMLDLCENKLSVLADSFDGLSELSCLNLGRNPFENQKRPYATGNFLTSLPKSFCQLKKVTLLSLDGNQLKSLPNNFADLVNLKMLNLVQNCLETLPDSFCDLQCLELCLLSRNSLQRLPKKIGNLPLLNHLELSDNKLRELPSSFKNLVKLTYLDLSSNRLQEEPDCLHLLTHLNYLNLHSNPFEHSADDVVNPELSLAYVGQSSGRGQFEDLESDEEAKEPNLAIQNGQEGKEDVTLTYPAVQTDHPSDGLPKIEHHNGTKGNQMSESRHHQTQQRDEEEDDDDEEDEEEDWGLSNDLCDEEIHNSADRYMFMPADLHCKNVNYNSGPFRSFPGQFDDADD